MSDTQLFQMIMTLKPVPKEVVMQKGQAEDAYAQKQIAEGKIQNFFVSEDHKHYWITFAVKDEAELNVIVRGFPLHDYFDYSVVKVMDIAALVKSGVTSREQVEAMEKE